MIRGFSGCHHAGDGVKRAKDHNSIILPGPAHRICECLRGVGEGTVEMGEKTLAARIMEMEPYLLGKNPFNMASDESDTYFRCIIGE